MYESDAKTFRFCDESGIFRSSVNVVFTLQNKNRTKSTNGALPEPISIKSKTILTNEQMSKGKNRLEK
jgi:hypothetical protein